MEFSHSPREGDEENKIPKIQVDPLCSNTLNAWSEAGQVSGDGMVGIRELGRRLCKDLHAGLWEVAGRGASQQSKEQGETPQVHQLCVRSKSNPKGRAYPVGRGVLKNATRERLLRSRGAWSRMCSLSSPESHWLLSSRGKCNSWFVRFKIPERTQPRTPPRKACWNVNSGVEVVRTNHIGICFWRHRWQALLMDLARGPEEENQTGSVVLFVLEQLNQWWRTQS